MTGALVVYSATFARYALAVTPKNFLLFGCHAINFSAQSVQGYRYLNYWKYVMPVWFGLVLLRRANVVLVAGAAVRRSLLKLRGRGSRLRRRGLELGD